MDGTSAGGGERARVIVAHGARAAEAVLLAEADRLLVPAATDLTLLARPVRIVVPSRSLRQQVGAAIVAPRGRAVAGVTVQTLHGLANEVLERAGEGGGGGALLPVLVQRFARDERPLWSPLDALEDGYAGLAGTVRDLLDAGFEAAHGEGIDERLAELERGASEPAVERARAIVRVASRAFTAMEQLGVVRPSTLLRRATELVLADAERYLPARAVLVHGFAEATGLASDLLEALARRCAAVVVLDEPPDSADPSRPDLGVAFTRRLRERMEGAAGLAKRESSTVPAADIAMFRAPGAFAEAREVTARIRALLDDGVRAESIAVVARTLESYRLPIHQHFSRLAIPFSAPWAPGLRGPASRRVEALAELLREGPQASADAWLAAGGGVAGASTADTRLALRVAGATRLLDVADLPVDELLRGATWLPLPVRRGLEDAEPEEGSEENAENGGSGEPEPLAARRRGVPAGALRRLVARAAALAEAWRLLPQRTAIGVHVGALRRLVTVDLAWRAGSGEGRLALTALRKLEDEVPPALQLDRAEALLLVAEALRDTGRAGFGGNGAGVQVLGVVEARARTFEHLFLLGANRDAFPRVIREDALLPDRLRAALLPLLPDLPLKRTGFDEERYLFAQLLSASPHVNVSWLECDDDGKPQSPSPLVDRLRSGGAADVEVVPDLFSPASSAREAPRPAHEHAVVTGLRGDRPAWRGTLATALAASGAVEAGAAAEVAAARLAVLNEIDPDRRTAEGRARSIESSPYLGLVGEINIGGRDARSESPSVTTLEALAGCPWQTFLARVLRLEPVPDPAAALPALSGTLVGSVVHGVLERIAQKARDEVRASLNEVVARAAHPVTWPEEGELEGVVAEVVGEQMIEEGIWLPLLGRALAARARPFLDAAFVMDFAGGALEVLGVEVEGEVEVRDAAGRARSLAFRADRVDRAGGSVRLTDYKTGKPFSAATRDVNKQRMLLRAVAGGSWLQAAAYALAAGAGGSGRYLFLRPDITDAARVFEASGDDPMIRHELYRAATVLLAAWDAGAFFPRLVVPDGSKALPRCAFCRFREACSEGDSGSRRRLLAWMGALQATEPVAGIGRAAAGVWMLAARPPKGDGSGTENG